MNGGRYCERREGVNERQWKNRCARKGCKEERQGRGDTHVDTEHFMRRESREETQRREGVSEEERGERREERRQRRGSEGKKKKEREEREAMEQYRKDREEEDNFFGR